MPLIMTDEQYNAMPGMRAGMRDVLPPIRDPTQCPDPTSLPSDLTVRVETAPPSVDPHPLLNSSLLKKADPVPVFFYAICGNDQIEADVADTRVIFFIHGGGNVSGHPSNQVFVNLYAEFLRALIEHSGGTGKFVLVAPYYRIARIPENAFPAALQDLLAAYDYVLDKGYKSSNILITGDSAGGNHAFVLTHLLLQSGRPSVVPHGIAAIAPMSIQVYDNMSEQAKKNTSGFDILDIPKLEMCTSWYTREGVSRTDPLVSGAFLPFTASWPKSLILIGTGDSLIDSSRELKKRLEEAGAPVELVEYDGFPHGWDIFPNIFGDLIQDASKRIAQFLLG